ncbi:hypothetical protein OSB04_005096 [Centaurea solstitialis]|uniref:Remorin C-terminal domain-containing protein n=1 Tax=Centaurea solstitialis TaxID=347529 RepID=A0AA38TT78_9ASTR|nr:hypothetical protein OSB04_005096 [Centaurea solstitialis]
MDLKSSKYPPFSSSHHGGQGQGVAGVRKEKPLLDGSVCKLNLKESSDSNNVIEAPSTPGRPVFSFSVGNNVSRKNLVPSKWNDAEKWLVSDHITTILIFMSSDFVPKKSNSNKQLERHDHQTKLSPPAAEEKVQKAVSISTSSDVLKDKFTNEVVQANFLKYECSEPLRESFIFRDPSMVDDDDDAVVVKSRDIGTEMTPLGSSTTSRCPTPFKSLSPPRHNTPATRSGPLVDLGTSFDIGDWIKWSSREEEEEDISKSLRHFEINNEFRKSISEPRASAWEEEDKTKCCLRYQREEAKIQAWVDLQNAKAEAQSRKLEVKIQKMRSNFEEKVMRKMAIVRRKAEELRAAAQLEHTEQIQKATEQAKKTMNQHLSMHFSSSCGCFPCNNHIHS